MVTGVSAAVGIVDLSMARPDTVKDLWDQYQLHLKATLNLAQSQQEIRLTQTALVRYTLPGWGGPVPLSERLSPLDLAASMQAAESISLVQFQTALVVFERVMQQLEADYQEHSEPVKDQKKYFQGVRKRNKHYLNKLWDWANEQGWFEPPAAQKQPPEIYCFYEQVEGKAPFQDLRLTQRKCSNEPAVALDKPGKGRVRKDTFALGKVKRDVINPVLQTQLDDLKASLMDGRLGEQLKKVTAEHNLNSIMQALGWAHRVEAGLIY